VGEATATILQATEETATEFDRQKAGTVVSVYSVGKKRDKRLACPKLCQYIHCHIYVLELCDLVPLNPDPRPPDDPGPIDGESESHTHFSPNLTCLLINRKQVAAALGNVGDLALAWIYTTEICRHGKIQYSRCLEITHLEVQVISGVM
jgi:hypothetical protein